MQKTQRSEGRSGRRGSSGLPLSRLLQRGIELQRAERFKEAEYHYQLVLREEPGHADALNLLGTLAAEAKLYDKAVDCLERAVRARPKDPVIRNNLAHALILDGRHEGAIVHLRRAIKAKPRFLEALCNLGRALRGAGKPAQAIEWFDKALALDARYRTAMLGRAESLADLGRMRDAEDGYRAIIAKHPGDALGYLGLSGTRKFSAEDPEVAAIEKLLGNEHLSPQDRELLHSAAGKICNDQKRYDDAFAHFQRAKEILGRDFDVAAHSTFIDRTMKLFSPMFFAARKGFGESSDRPVFIVGMPRSGTTLTEQILSSHAEIHGAGELRDMQALVWRLAGRARDSEAHFECIERLDARQCKAVAREYLDTLAKFSSSAMRVTDKMPHNFELLGFIALLFPNARVIHCRRDPLDNCVSCFTHRFNSSHGYNASLTKLGLYFRQYDRLMAHWREVLPLQMLEVRYEDMIADQQGMSRELVAFLGLDWDDACLAYHEAERSVRTLSRWQVRQPIYSSSVKRWRNYEAHLEPLIAALGPLADTS